MKIVVGTTLLGHVSQDRFFVRLSGNSDAALEYTGKFEAGTWEFELRRDNMILLRSQRIKLSAWQTLLGREVYRILHESNELFTVNKVLLKGTIIWNGREYSFPSFSQPRIEDFELTFPWNNLLWGMRVRSYCDSTDPKKILPAIAITILVWLRWNAIASD